jgi:hypothetical protein
MAIYFPVGFWQVPVINSRGSFEIRNILGMKKFGTLPIHAISCHSPIKNNNEQLKDRKILIFGVIFRWNLVSLTHSI